MLWLQVTSFDSELPGSSETVKSTVMDTGPHQSEGRAQGLFLKNMTGLQEKRMVPCPEVTPWGMFQKLLRDQSGVLPTTQETVTLQTKNSQVLPRNVQENLLRPQKIPLILTFLHSSWT